MSNGAGPTQRQCVIFMISKWNLSKWTKCRKSQRTWKWKAFQNRLEKHINANSLKYAFEILNSSSQRKNSRCANLYAKDEHLFIPSFSSPPSPLLPPLILHLSHFHMNIYSPKLSGKSSFCWILNEHRKNKAFYMVTVPFLTMNRWNDVIWYDKIHVTFQRSICIWFVIWRYLRLKREHRNSLPAC